MPSLSAKSPSGSRPLDPGPSLLRQLHLRIQLGGPAVSQQTRNSDLERLLALRRVAVEDPLRGVVRVWLGETVRILLLCYLAPVVEVEWDLHESGVGYVQLLVDPAHGFVVLGRRAESTRWQQVASALYGTSGVQLLSNSLPRIDGNWQACHTSDYNAQLSPEHAPPCVKPWSFRSVSLPFSGQ